MLRNSGSILSDLTEAVDSAVPNLLARIAKIVKDHNSEIVETWNEYFGD